MFAMEEHIKGGWSVTMYSDGRQIVGELHRETPVFTFFWNMPVTDDHIMPEFVRHMLYEQRDAHRHCFRLHRSYRLPVVFAKRVPVRWKVDKAHSRWPTFGRRNSLVLFTNCLDKCFEYLPV